MSLGTLSFDVQSTEIVAAGFTLSDFDDGDLSPIIKMLVTAGPITDTLRTVYRHVDNGGPLGILSSDSDDEAQTGQTVTRIAMQDDGEIRFWDNPSTITWGSLFPADTDFRVYFQTETAGPFEFII